MFSCVDIRVKEGLLSSTESDITGGAVTSESMDSLSAIPSQTINQSIVESGNTNKRVDQTKSDSMDNIWPETNWRVNTGGHSERYSDRQTNSRWKCYNCQEWGHTKSHCPQPLLQTQPQRRDANRYHKPQRKQGKDWNREEVIWATEGDRPLEKAVPLETIYQPKSGNSGNCWLFLQDYYLSDKLSDISFKVEGQTLFAHRFVLGAKSNDLKKMLFDKRYDKTIELNDTNVDAFRLVLKYLYFDSLDGKDIPFNLLIEVMKLSKRYHLDTLSVLIERQLISSLDIKNVLQLFNSCKEYGLKDLIKPINDFIGDNAMAIIDSKLLLNQSVDTITEFLLAFKSQKAIITAFKSLIESKEMLDLEPFKKLIQLNDCSIEDIGILKEIGLFDINLLFDLIIEKSKEYNKNLN